MTRVSLSMRDVGFTDSDENQAWWQLRRRQAYTQSVCREGQGAHTDPRTSGGQLTRAGDDPRTFGASTETTWFDALCFQSAVLVGEPLSEGIGRPAPLPGSVPLPSASRSGRSHPVASGPRGRSDPRPEVGRYLRRRVWRRGTRFGLSDCAWHVSPPRGVPSRYLRHGHSNPPQISSTQPRNRAWRAAPIPLHAYQPIEISTFYDNSRQQTTSRLVLANEWPAACGHRWRTSWHPVWSLPDLPCRIRVNSHRSGNGDRKSNEKMDQDREKLLKAKLGDLLTWSRPEIVETIGPHDPMAFDAYDAHRLAVIEDCSEWLRQCTDDQIAILAGKQTANPSAAGVEWPSHLSRKVNRLSESKPPWYAGGFGHPDRQADLDYWTKMSRFSIAEILCLSVGVEPAAFPEKMLSRLAEKPETDLWPALAFLVRRHEQLKRQFDPSGNDWSVDPTDFLTWVEKVGFECHSELLRLLRQIHCSDGAPVADRSAAPKPDKREINTIAQLFTLMAIDHLGYRPNQKRSPIPREIADLAAQHGLKISDDTVRKYLRIGEKFLPEDWEPNNTVR